ncbi:protocatechuate 3,4-dioxygenase subunit alpha [Acinetobacter johnsonii]|uniref:Protocatechuate 3,4-dioxygenase subunit alpha n=1 Tax=Acinetobacter johnsonii TaxID=40214 RepID=A0AA42XJV0_ACIJO|nr:protocatechuate 3,4-dioxygenase subunit alpha [Acinetobacter johnsonii]MDH0657119.1 protocatechuate 3,4-dioxygenase subunit alpha [Acinetobacter johnsonii]MDH0836751.1 protocatechuate 3,4-dioxygenase subunit alpha [Acinetobacter johnsonii]MDH0840244.1 protocatechuate 3,4-dioxygenase subunit alpha [Acinetobacter johnsonii]MDH2173819.1 protocatechuate 3,4-dioxygenase subunit alpha [Acinetobacter johnsonii]MDH2177032.1 protocatechuate 3,4-dioxygenase subunit alpha [Acinetobacter johnsonii]
MNHWNFQELHETPSQTGGPYVHIGLLPQQANIKVFENNFNNQLVQENTLGERIRLEGQVFDGLGLPLRDVLIEIWQADANGVYPSTADIQDKVVDPNFLGWGRTGADFETGFWSFNTVKPGAVPGRKGTTQAPHIALIIFARGINIGLNTRVYFEDEAEANAQDPVLNGIEWAPRRQTLIAKREERDGEVVYRFDIHIQGEDETVFLDI